MSFAAPLLAVALALVPALAALYAYAARRRRHAVAAFLGGAAQAAGARSLARRRRVKAAAVVAAAGLLAVALMRPQAGETVEDIPRHGRDLIFVLDVSRSMLAEDAPPSRLAAAKDAIRRLVDALGAEGGHRLALIAFAGQASVAVPLTLDYRYFLDRLDAAGETSVARRGSLIGDALRKALSLVGAEDAAYSDLILLSDGEDHGSLVLEAAQEAATRGVALSAVGIGDPLQGARIPVADADGGWQPLRHDGAEVTSRLDEALLVQLARLGHGSYLGARTGPLDLERLVRATIAVKAGREIEVTSGLAARDLFQWLVLAAFALLLAEALWPERAAARTPRAAATFARAAACVAAALMVAGFARSSDPYDALARANALYDSGAYAEAADGYRAALAGLEDAAVARFNLGDALFALRDLDAAEQAFATALLSEDTALAALASYNLGNLRYAQALDALDEPGEARRRLEQAIAHYRASRTLDPANADVMYNLELAYRLLAMLRQREGPDGPSGQPSRADEARDRGVQRSVGGFEPGNGDVGLQDQGRHGQPTDPGDMLPQGAPSRDDATQNAPGGGGQYQMSMDEAEQIVDIVRTHSRSLEAARRQWRNARMREADVERPW